jgi:pyridoxine kinase
MTVISIQSQVAYGHVGNSAAVFPMQMHGIDVIAVPTTLLSNRPGYPTIRGRVLDAQLVADLLLGIEERGAVETSQVILSGYLGSAQIASVVADFVERAKARNPTLTYCCDPVLGDRDGGLFVQADIPPLMRDVLCPLADVITPNHFEFEWLCGAKAATIDHVIEKARALMPRGPSTIVITSAELADTPEGQIETIAVERSQTKSEARSEAQSKSLSKAWRVCTPKLPISPFGTGDLFASLFVSARVRGSDTPDALSHAASAIFSVLERTAAHGTEEMRIVESAALFTEPKRRFDAIDISG